MLKAFFNENFVIQNPVVPNEDGTELVPYEGDPLTIGGELNKLGSNIAIGRNFAGVHYRSDAYESMLLGEQVAIHILEEMAYTWNINFQNGFSLTKFDGTVIRVGGKKQLQLLPS
jgi:putative heme degradation protein